MQRLMATSLLLIVLSVSGCSAVRIGSSAAVCNGTASAQDTLAEKIVEHRPHPEVRIAAAEWMVKQDTGCKR